MKTEAEIQEMIEKRAEEYSNPAKLDRRNLNLSVVNHMNLCKKDYHEGVTLGREIEMEQWQAKVQRLVSVIQEAVSYLEVTPIQRANEVVNSISTGSRLHEMMIQALAQFISGRSAKGVTVPRELFQELVDNCQASIAEHGISTERTIYRKELYERAKGIGKDGG